MAEPYTPTEAEIVNGSYHLGDNFWRELTEAEVTRGIAAIKAETLRAERARIAAAIEAAQPVREHVGYRLPPPEGCLCDECHVTAQRQMAFEDAARIALGEQP